MDPVHLLVHPTPRLEGALTQLPTEKMGSSPPSLECLDLTRDPNVLEPGSEEWKLMSQRLIEALETHGGVIVEYLSDELFDETFSALRDLLDHPIETKLEITKSYPNCPNVLPGSARVPYYEVLVLENSVRLEEVRAFTQVIWTHGNDKFSNTINRISMKLQEAVRIILEMIFDSYGVRSHYDSQIRNTTQALHMMKYTAQAKCESIVALVEHFDSNILTALYQNGVNGLQLKSKEGEWIPVNIPRKGSFAIIVGQALEGWSNGSLVAPLHRVVMSPDNDRFSVGFNLAPKLEQVIEAPHELVDYQHPRLFKTFTYKDLLEHDQDFDTTLRMFAGI